MIKITNYSELFNNVFTKMEVQNELPEFWWEEPYHEISESLYFDDVMFDDYREENNITQKQAEEFHASDEWSEYQSEWIMDYLDHYVTYKVEGNNLDKLPEYVPVYWIEELNSYVFLQSWYGMAAYMMKLNPFDWEGGVTENA